MMFSGIVEMCGLIKSLTVRDGCKHFTILPSMSMHDLKIGESVAINGVCLTVTNTAGCSFQVTAVPETLRLSNLNLLTLGEAVNLERSLMMGGRIGGHQVQGHIDSMGEIIELSHDHSNAWLVKISIPPHLSKYIVTKGYIGIDGMSITVIETHTNLFSVTLIPHTQDTTIATKYSRGTMVNIEVDILGKYIEKLLGVYQHDRAY